MIRACLTRSVMLFCLFGATAFGAEPKSGDIARVYSNICFHGGETGHLAGQRVIILRLPEGDYVQYEEAGVMYKKMGAHMGRGPAPTTVSLTIGQNGSDFDFAVSEPAEPAKISTFHGTMTKTLLTGRFHRRDGTNDAGGEELRLPRVTPVSHGFSDCDTAPRGEHDSGDVVRVYSSLCFHTESGDVLGDRMIVFRLPEGDYVQYEQSDAMYEKMGSHGPTPPTLSLKVTANGRAIEFAAWSPSALQVTGVFHGKMTDALLTGRFHYQNGRKEILGERLSLPRVTRAHHGFADCH